VDCGLGGGGPATPGIHVDLDRPAEQGRQEDDGPAPRGGVDLEVANLVSEAIKEHLDHVSIKVRCRVRRAALEWRFEPLVAYLAQYSSTDPKTLEHIRGLRSIFERVLARLGVGVIGEGSMTDLCFCAP